MVPLRPVSDDPASDFCADPGAWQLMRHIGARVIRAWLAGDSTALFIGAQDRAGGCQIGNGPLVFGGPFFIHMRGCALVHLWFSAQEEHDFVAYIEA